MTRSLADVLPSPAARDFVEIIHRENPDPRVGAWFAWECMYGGMFERVERIAEPSKALEVAPQAQCLRGSKQVEVQERLL